MITRSTNYTTHQFRMSEIYNFQTRQIERADFWLKQDLEVVHQLKDAIKQDKKAYGCPICKTPLMLKAGAKKHAHFAHVKREVGVECLLCEDNQLTEAQKKIQRYNYAKEREAHKKLKRFLGDYIKKETAAEKVKIDRIKSGAATSHTWRNADISCQYKGKKIVLEIQPANVWIPEETTKRSQFYQENKVHNLRVYDSFPTQIKYAKNTNSQTNFFVLDEVAQQKTEENSQLYLHCYYQQPTVDPKNKIIKNVWTSELVSIDHLQFDANTYQPYFVSYTEKQTEAEQRLSIIQRAHAQDDDVMKIPGKKVKRQQIAKDYAQMTEQQVIRLIFENKLSRTLINLKNRISELVFEEGYAIPQNLIEILETQGSIQRIHANTSQVHYQKMVFES